MNETVKDCAASLTFWRPIQITFLCSKFVGYFVQIQVYKKAPWFYCLLTFYETKF